jgi:hypothetical protein
MLRALAATASPQEERLSCRLTTGHESHASRLPSGDDRPRNRADEHPVRRGLGRKPPMPLLVQEPYLSIDRDLPLPVRDRKIAVVKDLNERAKAAARLPATAANGCVPSSFGSLGSPAPSISSRLLGHHVEVVFNFSRMPASPACRPFELTVVVYAGKKASSSFKNSVGRFWLQGPRGRAVVDLPWTGNPPYHVIVSSATITGRRGPEVERSLRCPGTRSVVRGCLAGYRPTAHTNPMPKPVLPVRGLDLSFTRGDPALRGIRTTNAADRRLRTPIIELRVAEGVHRDVCRSRFSRLAVPGPLSHRGTAGAGLLARLTGGRDRSVAVPGRDDRAIRPGSLFVLASLRQAAR